MLTLVIVTIIIASVLVAIGRFLIPGHHLSWPGTYEAFAHIYVGAVLVMMLDSRFSSNERWFAGVGLLVTTVLEVVMFIRFKNSSATTDVAKKTEREY